MQYQAGMIVFSKAGHDANSFYVLVKVEGAFGYIADGRRRKLSDPKRKNLLHLKPTNSLVDVTALDTDKKIRRVLHELNFAATSVAD